MLWSCGIERLLSETKSSLDKIEHHQIQTVVSGKTGRVSLFILSVIQGRWRQNIHPEEGRIGENLSAGRDMIRLAEKEPDVGMEIHYSGLCPSEKLYVVLIAEGEKIVPTGHETILVMRSQGEDFTDRERLFGDLDRAAGLNDASGVKEIL